MPTYEYRCPNGHEFERFFRSINAAEAEVVKCPTCGAVAERRISGGAGLLFKGSGFYITDYGKDGKKDQRPAAKSDASGPATATGDAAGGDAKSGASAAAPAGESKPAAEGKPAAESKPAPAPKGTGSSE